MFVIGEVSTLNEGRDVGEVTDVVIGAATGAATGAAVCPRV